MLAIIIIKMDKPSVFKGTKLLHIYAKRSKMYFAYCHYSNSGRIRIESVDDCDYKSHVSLP